MFSDDREEFKKWLIEELNHSQKTARDCIYRCNRIDKNISDFTKLAKSDNGFEILRKKIKEYSTANGNTTKSKYSLNGTLCLSAKKYSKYKKSHSK